jgi:triosephosphate isomerase
VVRAANCGARDDGAFEPIESSSTLISGAHRVRRRLVAGNWKMHGSLAANRTLLEGIVAGLDRARGVDVAVCAPFPYLAQLADRLRGSALRSGAQNVSEHESGAYTGEVSAAMLAEFACHYVIVGHSERRTLYGETDAQVAAKVVAAQRAGLVPILCVGERLEERENGTTTQVVLRQLDAVAAKVGAGGFARAVIAYEPVWAIGTGKTATPEQAQEVHAVLRAQLARADAAIGAQVPILYGGSVKGANAAELFAQPDIDGGLIGGASLNAAEFLQICAAAAAAPVRN